MAESRAGNSLDAVLSRWELDPVEVALISAILVVSQGDFSTAIPERDSVEDVTLNTETGTIAPHRRLGLLLFTMANQEGEVGRLARGVIEELGTTVAVPAGNPETT